ncbi:acetolactate synthase small subunit [Streptomyces sp. SID14478]|uniref:acetolactate synthase small subunit n=1 Tax=Streptomyces sp. SID14478 TaxID=2706073 RepID=UPI0013DD2CF3|nr:acetolactate synthase small subunit [Streptomyces sp. SID14478]NEB73643.1 acetolactate synthase small subunit [Streptomyces sp. SID14478]
MTKHTLSVHLENKAGALVRVAALFSRRGFNIESLAVGPADEPGTSHMSIAVCVDERPLEQIVQQLSKLVNVISVQESSA